MLSLPAQAVTLHTGNPVLELGGTGYWVENYVKEMVLVNSSVYGQSCELKHEVVSSDVVSPLVISGERFLMVDNADSCDVIIAHGVSIDAGGMTAQTLASKVLDTEPKVLLQGTEGVVLELRNGTQLSGGNLGNFNLAGSSVVVNGEMRFARGVDVLKLASGSTVTLKNTRAHAEYAIDMENATLVLDNAVLSLGEGEQKKYTAEFVVNNVYRDKNTIVIQTGQEAMKHLNLSTRPLVGGTIKGTGRLENLRMQGSVLEVGAPGSYGSLTLREVELLKNNGRSSHLKFNVNAAGGFNFAGANTAGGTNFSQLKLDGHANYAQFVNIELAYQNGTAADLAKKFSRGATLRLIDVESGSMGGTYVIDYENLPALADGLVWYTYELFLTGDLVVVDDYLTTMAAGLILDDEFDTTPTVPSEAEPEKAPGEESVAPAPAISIRLDDLKRIAVQNQAMDASRVANTLAAVAATTRAFGNTALGHANDVRRGRSNAWFTSYFSCLDRASTGSRTGYDANTLGYAVGLDTYLRPYNAVVGAALGYSDGTMIPNHGNYYYSAGKIDTEGIQLGVYGRCKPAGWKVYGHSITLEGYISYGTYDCHSRRAGLKNGDVVTGRWDESAWSMGLTASTEYRLRQGVTITPFAGIEFTTSSMEGFREYGYTEFDYADQQGHRNLAFLIGADVRKSFSLPQGQYLIPHASLKLGLDIHRQHARVVGSSPAGSIVAEETHPGRCSLQLNMGADWVITRSWTANAAYLFEMRDAATEQQIQVSASRSF